MYEWDRTLILEESKYELFNPDWEKTGNVQTIFLSQDSVIYLSGKGKLVTVDTTDWRKITPLLQYVLVFIHLWL